MEPLFDAPARLRHTIWYCNRSIKAAFGQERSCTASGHTSTKISPHVFWTFAIDSVIAKFLQELQQEKKESFTPAAQIGIHSALFWCPASGTFCLGFRRSCGRSRKVNTCFIYIWLPGDLWEKCVSTLFILSPLQIGGVSFFFNIFFWM